jgi:uncharacterized small protein (DUF1192 family)
MTTVNISPEVALQEERAISATLKNRVLILAQGVAELRDALARSQEEVENMKAQLETAQRVGGDD